jgi:hypothetical protein
MSERPVHSESELVELVRSIDVRAPDELRHRIDTLIDEHSAHASRRPFRAWIGGGQPALRLAGVGAILVVALVLIIGLPGGGSTALSLREASALTLSPATMGAPAENPRRRTELVAGVDGVAFPDWEHALGWRATGARIDRIGGRSVRTVFYANDRGQRIGYAIVAGTPAPAVGDGGVVTWRTGTDYRMLSARGAQVVVWQRDGRLCVLSGRGVSAVTLLALASWTGS